MIARQLASLTIVFEILFFLFPREIKTIGNNWNNIGTSWVRFGYLGNSSVVQNRGNTIAIVFCATSPVF